MSISNKCRNNCIGNFDPSDLVNGYCEECRERMEKREERDGMLKLMIDSDFRQMELDEINGHGIHAG